MYRLIPFKKLSDIDDISCSLKDLYLDCLRSNTVLIQDTEDMVVEEYSVQELYDISKKYGVSYSCFGFDDDEVKLYNSYYLAIDEDTEFLNKTLSIKWVSNGINPSRNPSVDIFKGMHNVRFEYALRVSNSSKGVFKFTSVTYYFFDGEYEVSGLFVNDSPIILVDTSAIFFRLVQICKTEKGFELIVTFPDLNMFLGIKLGNDLEFLGFQNLEYFMGMSLVGGVDDFESVKLELAKRKLTNNWSRILPQIK